MATARYKIGDNVRGRIITGVYPRTMPSGQETFDYAYRCKNEPEDIEPMYCTQTTLYRFEYPTERRRR